ncbi:hypothetical protein yrohd0001_4770 [Yersinia rohdei ATCC 43380]|nr:hypothetical protein yrohd0001_4770 [Yersinia rohdei ATCC 43380]
MNYFSLVVTLIIYFYALTTLPLIFIKLSKIFDFICVF